MQAAEADAIGSSASGDLMAALSPLLDAPDVSVRQAAVEAAGRVAEPLRVKPLIAVVRDVDEEISVRRAAIRAICDVRARARTPTGEDVADALLLCLGDASPVIRACAGWAIGRLRLTACVSALDGALGDANVVVRWQAAGALACVGTSADQSALRDALRDGEKVFGRTVSDRARAAMARIALRQVWERVKGLAAAIGKAASREKPHKGSSGEGQQDQ